MTDWNPERYLKFRSERTRPAIDLVARISLDTPGSIIDIGCGPGNSTAVLAARWPDAAIVGLDSSPEMIGKARTDYPSISWVLGDAAQYSPPEKFDLVFSNAALQWIPDHDVLVPRLFGMVNRGGALAVQVPANQNSFLHRALLSVAAVPRWAAITGDWNRVLNYRSGAYYYDLLCGSAAKIDMWETTYHHVLPDHRALIDWYKSTGMRPCLDRIPGDALKAEFEREVLEACREEYPPRKDGKIIFPFSRVFFVAYRE